MRELSRAGDTLVMAMQRCESMNLQGLLRQRLGQYRPFCLHSFGKSNCMVNLKVKGRERESGPFVEGSAKSQDRGGA